MSWDAFPDGQKEMPLFRGKLTIVQPGEEEKYYDRDPGILEHVESDNEQIESLRCLLDGENSTKPASKKKETMAETEMDRFLKQSDDQIRATTSYDLYYGDSPEQKVTWKILPDTEHITDDPLQMPEEAEFFPEMDWDLSFEENFFQRFFPDITGHGKILDEYLSDSRASYHDTAVQCRITFHDPSQIDCDWKVKQCYLLLIAAATEVENGVENLWSRGSSGGRHDYPDFGRYMPVNYFKAFQSAAPYAWCDKKCWFIDKRDKPWDVFMPCLSQYNEKRKTLLRATLLVLDESMSGWRPKTSKLGGLPNYTYEPRKPVPLGTMFRNGAECITGCFVFQDVVQNPEIQIQKDYYGELSCLPHESDIKQHTAEVLRQVEGAGVQKGGWVGGDAWFGSVLTSCEVMKRMGVHSTFVIKNNTTMYPKNVLFSVLNARHKKTMGHWVVATAKVAGVDLIAIAYAWSQKGVAYFISTCGKTSPAKDLYVSKFENEFGMVDYKEIQRPQICHFLYQYLPLIDEHNKQRQSYLALERCWPTRCCWFRLLVTIVGMSVVDFHRVYRNVNESKKLTEIEDNDLRIRWFSDQICGRMKGRDIRITQRVTTTSGQRDSQQKKRHLERINNNEGNVYRKPTTKQQALRRSVGTPINKKCFVCRKYLLPDGATNYRDTIWQCSQCKMPLCKQIRTAPGRTLTCFEEHCAAPETDEVMGCLPLQGAEDRFIRQMPQEYKVQIQRRSNRLAVEDSESV